MTNIISVSNLVKRYKKATQNAVDDISFNVQEGKLFALLGPNGAGKTTTISILTTTLSKTTGQIYICGFDTEKDSSEVRKRVGIIFQNPSLDLNLTAEENIRFHSILYGLFPFRPALYLMPDPYKKRVKDLAEVLELGNDILKPVKTFSGGMKRKLEIIRSLMHKPKVLFLDEPTIGLDPQARKNLWKYLMNVKRQENTTIFLTTHYLEEAEAADDICIINHGKIIASGTPRQIKDRLIDQYLLIDAKNRPNLISELKKLKVNYTQAEFPVKVKLKQQSTAQKIIKSIKTPLTLLQTHSPTLEEAYLDIIGTGNLND